MLEKRRLANRKLCANHFAQASAFLTTRHRHQSGFAIAPVLYLLVLAGVASSVLFGGYSQILRGNVSVTNSQIVKTDLSGSLTTLAASAKLSTDGLLFCPPGSSTRSVECTPAPEKLVLFANVPAADSAKLPNNYSNVTTAGSPYEAGVFSAGSGLKQIDPWGHFYIYCRWENARATPDAPAIVLISAGKNAQVETTCGSTEPVGDDQMQFISVGAAIQRAAIWQESGSNVEYGQTGQKVIISNEGDIEAENILVHGTATFDSLHLTQPLPIVSGGTAADNIIDARINLGAGAVGDALFLATTTPGARGTLGATVIGDYLFSSATLVADTASAARLQLLGAGAIGNDLFVSETAPAARSVLGATAMGDYLFSSSSYDGVLGPAVRTTLLGSSAIGDAVFVAADTDTALTALGGTTVGKGVFTAATATAARTALGGGAVGSPLFTSPDQATAWTILGLIGGTATLDISVTGSAGSVDGANITGIVPIAHGGTSAVSASAALDNLFGGDSSPGVGTLNVDRLAANSIDSGKLTNVVTAGTYNNVTVDEAGRVVSGAMVTYDNSRITDGVGESIVATASDGGKLVFSTASAVRMVLDSIGNLGIGIEDPEEKLHIFGGNARISGPSDGYRELQFATSTDQMRWIMAADDATETGVGDAGSNLVINRFDDAGNEYNVLTIDRPTGNATFAGSVAATGGFLGYFTGTFDGTFIGTINSSINLGESTASPNPRRNGEANTGLYSDAAGQVQVSITGTERLRVTATGVVSDGVLSSDTMVLGGTSLTSGTTLDMSAVTNSMLLPKGATAARPTGVEGMVRYNTDDHALEVYQGSTPSWVQLAINTTTAGSSTYLGGSATLTSPSRGDDVTTGLFSDTAGQVQVSITGTERLRVTATSVLADGLLFSDTMVLGGTSLTSGTTLDMSAVTNSMLLPKGATAARPTGVEGMVRYNTDDHALEVYQGSTPSWVQLAVNTTTAGSSTYLGGSATLTSPSRSDDVTTGLFSNAAGQVQVSITGTERLRVTATGVVSDGVLSSDTMVLGGTSLTSGTTLDMSAVTNSMLLPKGATAARPTGVEGMVRYNTDDHALEVYQGSTPSWVQLAINTTTAGSSTYLGGSATLTSPSRSDDVTTGLFSNAAGQVQVSIAGTERLRVTATSVVSDGLLFSDTMVLGGTSLTSGTTLDMSAVTNSMLLPKGATAARPAGVEGMVRYNTDDHALEVYQGSTPSWVQLAVNTTTAGSSTYLGGSATLTSPSRSDDVTTGLFSDTAGQVQVSITGTERLRVTATGVVSDGVLSSDTMVLGGTSLTSGTTLDMSAVTNSMLLPKGATAARPTGVEGMVRYNTDDHALEVYQGSTPSWVQLAVNTTTAGSSTYLGGSATLTSPSRSDDVTTGLFSNAAGQVQVSITGTERLRVTATSVLADGLLFSDTMVLGGTSLTSGTTLDMSAVTNSMLLPKGATAARPTGVEGMVRYNTDDHALEVYQGSTPSWVQLAVNTTTAGSSTYLGGSATLTSPSRSDDVTTGLFSNAAGQVQVSITGTERLRVTATGVVSDGLLLSDTLALGATSLTTGSTFDMSNVTNSMILPKGATAARPTGVEGMVRYNTDDHALEVYQGSTPSWVQLAINTTTAGSSTYLGGSATLTSPSRSDDVTTGLFSDAAGQVQVSITGTERLRVTATGMHVVGNINLAALTNYIAVMGTKVLHQPASDTTSIGVGPNALAAQTATKLNNTAVGVSAMAATTTGNSNAALGLDAMKKNTSGSNNTAVGFSALYSAIAGNDNTAIGYEAMYSTTTGSNNTAVGFRALRANTTGLFNTAIGNAAIYQITSGSNNTAIGYAVGLGILTGSNNILIGTSSAVDTPEADTSNWLNIGNTIYGNLNTGSVALGGSATGVTAGTTLDLSNRTDSLLLTKGNNTTDRPTGVEGMIRYNTTDRTVEVYQGSTPAWVALSAGATGGSTMYLGGSATLTSPSRSDDVTTGLYSDAASTVKVSIGGTQKLAVTATGVNLTSATNGYAINNVNMLHHVGADATSVGIGPGSLQTMTGTGSYNYAFGYQALQTNTASGMAAGTYNNALGYHALQSNSATGTYTGGYNNAIGYVALSQNKGNGDGAGSYNNAMGYYALFSNTATDTAAGSSNNAIGNYALYANRANGDGAGSYNNSYGYHALYSNTANGSSAGTYNNAIGIRAIYTNVATGFLAGSYNNAVGARALYSNTASGEEAGSYNNAIGVWTLYSNSGIGDGAGSYNNAYGYHALYLNTGSGNTAIGSYALGNESATITGSRNVALGWGVGQTGLTSGSDNILIGTSSAVTTPTTSTSNWLNIGNTIYGNLSTGSVALGGSATGVTAGTTLDLSNRTDSLLLTKGNNTTDRPTGVEGMIRYNTTDHALEVYQGSTPGWVALGVTASGTVATTLGPAVGAPSPYRDGEATTGLYSDAAGQVQVGIAGTERLRVTATGLHVVGNINLASITNYLSISGTKILHQPASDSLSIGIGPGALAAQTATDAGNTAVGYYSMYGNTTGYANTAVGREALRANTEGVLNTAIGREALYATTSGQYNTAVGSSALRSNTTASNNTAVGSYALYTNTTGFQNSALGQQALYKNTIGSYNVALGYYALYNNTTAMANTAIGFQALGTTTTGGYNTAIGYNVMGSTVGTYNTALGTNAGAALTTGAYNTMIGNGVGFAGLTTGSRNILIGTSSAVTTPAVGTNDWLNIGNTIYGNLATGSIALGGSATGVTAGTTLDLSNRKDSLLLTKGNNTTDRPVGVEGMIRYNTTDHALEVYQGSTPGWVALGVTASGTVASTLGPAVGAPSPYRDGEATTGLYSSAAGQVQVGIAGTERLRVTATSVLADGLLFSDTMVLGGTSLTTGSTFDMSNVTNSMILPKGATAARPTGVEGMVRYNTDDHALEVYQGSTPSWVQLAVNTTTAGSTMYLGGSATLTSPSRSDDVTTGLYSSAAGQVQTSIAGTERLRVTATGMHMVGNINLAALTNYISITGTKVLWQPASDTTSIGVGPNALAAQTATNRNNTAVGVSAQAAMTTGVQNTAMGKSALAAVSTGSYNTAFGYNALSTTALGTYNTAIGTNAGVALTTGTYNTMLGNGVGHTGLTTGSRNILIGTSSAVTTPAVGTNDWLNIGNTIYGDLSTGRVALGAAAVTAGAIFDLSGATGTAKSSMILPKDTTTNRPTAGVEGMIRYNTTDRIVEVYQGSTPTWVQLDAAGTGTASSTLGASTATPSPYRSGEATTGLYSSAAGQVQTAIAGTERLRVTATGLHVVGNINLAAITNYYSIAGTKILHQPASDTTSIGVGPDTLFSQSATDLANVAVGYQAQPQTVGGYGNNAVGFQALYSNTSGYLNDALGYQALFSNQTGFSNVAVGKDALYSNVDGARNTAVGLAALRSTTGNSNTGLGFRAGRAITSGEGNVAIGYEVGYTTLATGSNNILIGTSSAVDTPAADTSNFLNIGNVINANISSQLVGINRGTTLAIHPFQVGTSSSNGNGAYLTSAGVWTSISDARVKENVKPLAYGIDDLMKLRPVSYDMKGTHEKQIGLIAQEVMKVVPEVVSGSEETRYGLSYDTLLALAIKSIQELKVANDNQAKTVAQLSEENVQLRAKIQDLHDHASGAKVTMDDHDLIMMVIKVGGALFVLMLTGVGLCGYGLWRAVRRKAA